MNGKGIVPLMGIGLIILVVALGVAVFQPLTLPTPGTNNQTLPSIVQHFSNENEIINAFAQGQALFGSAGGGRDILIAGAANSFNKSGAESTGDSSGAPAPSYSQTNVQVEGVDEADIVKTDGKYIYSFYRNRLIITQAYPSEDMKVVAQVNFDEENISPNQLFVNENQLVLLGYKYDNPGYPIPYARREGDIAVGSAGVAVDSVPPSTVSSGSTEASAGSGSSGAVGVGYATPTTTTVTSPDVATKIASPGIVGGDYFPYWGYSKSIVYVYDITDKTNPQLEKELEFIGNYVSSRMIDQDVYFVITSYPDYRVLAADAGGSIIPLIKEDGVEKPLAAASDIGYIAPIYAQQFITLGSLDLDTFELHKETIVGSAENVYASLDNLYMTHTIWNYWNPLPVGTVIDNPEDVIQKTNDSFQKTVMYKFALNHGDVDYQGYASVPGRVLNQFSMDEYNGNVRIATTIDQQWDFLGRQTTPSTNNVFVLNEDMKIIGSVRDLAPGESIYSARFIGERGYLVTFQKTDPLFVIDFSNPSNPTVLGKLKIPGYSNYLHPLDETHIIGVGKDAIPSKENDFAWYQGMKLAIFDVSDVENPKELHALTIGDRGTDSYALQDHKAFLYDAENQLLVLPIYLYEITDEVKQQYANETFENGNFSAYGVPTFQGAFVYKVTLSDGFVEQARISHIDKEVDLKSGYYYDWEYQVQRALFIGNTLYTISQAEIKANMVDGWKEISKVIFPQKTGEFTINYSKYGTFCLGGGCGSTNIVITKDKTSVDYYPGGGNYQSLHEEFNNVEYYNQIFPTINYDAFDAQQDQIGCPGCADGAVENITLTNGDFSAYISIDAGDNVKEIQPFLTKIRSVAEELEEKAKS